MASNRNVTPELDTKLTDFSFARKTGFHVKQQFVNKTLIPGILPKHITASLRSAALALFLSVGPRLKF